MKIIAPGTYPEGNEKVCPECGKKIHFDVKFTPYESWVDSLCDFFRNIFRRKRKDDKHDI